MVIEMKLSLRKNKDDDIMDDNLMSFEVINQTYVMMSKKLSQYLSVNQQLSCDKFLGLFDQNDQEKVSQIIKENKLNSQSIFKLKSKHIMKIIFNQNTNIGYFVPVDEIQIYTEKIHDLEQLVKDKESYLYEMSHELKTPLQTISSTIDILQKSKLTDEQKDLINDMTLALNQTIDSTHNILNFAKMKQGNYELKNSPIILSQLIDDMQHIFKSNLEQKNLYFRTTHFNDITFLSDESLIKQALTNILANAIKFTSNGGLYIETAVSSENMLKISIEDTGIGMTDEELNRLFKPFSQANKDIYSTYGGTGLGLSITQTIISLLNGNIQVESTYGSGTKMTISFPVELTKENINDSQNELVMPNPGIKVLIAEDNTLSLKATKQLLENANLKVEVARNGIEVINQFKDYPFDIILMDVSMPKMNGFEATKSLREKDQKIPIIAMTANTYDDHIKACYESGMTDILYKPFKSKDLYQIINKHIK